MHLSVNGTRIFVDADGSGMRWRDGTLGISYPPMVLLPGGPAASHMHYKNPLLNFGRLRDRFQLIYVDWRGAGDSDPAPIATLTLSQSVDDVEAIRASLGIEQWVVLGASAGGVWALAYAARYPERVIRLVPMHCPASCDRFGDVAEANARRAGITDPEALALYRGFATGALEDPVETWARSVRDMIIKTQQAVYIDPKRHPEAIKDHQRRWDSFPEDKMMAEFAVSHAYLADFRDSYNALELARSITVPTLMITGENDPVAPPEDARAIAGAISGAELYIHGGGHMPHGDEQVEFWEVIDSFLEPVQAVPLA